MQQSFAFVQNQLLLENVLEQNETFLMNLRLSF